MRIIRLLIVAASYASSIGCLNLSYKQLPSPGDLSSNQEQELKPRDEDMYQHDWSVVWIPIL